ncbi:MAG: hypothetical protein M0R80_07520 [Proteobacteria bacterium]|jgi:hypothetical protein|nr:hypothetical protein [Pseudomonadota bacterium]
MTPQEKYNRKILIVRCVFWLPLLVVGLLVVFHVIPKQCLWWHAGILATIFCCLLLYGLACGLLVRAAFRSKPNSFLQRLAYPVWMQRLRSIAPTLSPLVAFPYILELATIEKVFKEQGLQAAQDALTKWMHEYPERMMGMLQALAEKKAEQKNKMTKE